MMTHVEEFYLETKSGDSLLVEIVVEPNIVILLIGDTRYDLTASSVFELADALLLACVEMEEENGRKE